MKFLIISLIILFSISVGFVDVADGGALLKLPDGKGDPSFLEGYLQIQLRDSDGKLVAYYEPTRMWVVDSKLIHEILDTKENKSIISKDGRNFEVITWEQSEYYRGGELETAFGLFKDGKLALVDFPDGFFAEPGDTSSQFWTIVRPVS